MSGCDDEVKFDLGQRSFGKWTNERSRVLLALARDSVFVFDLSTATEAIPCTLSNLQSVCFPHCIVLQLTSTAVAILSRHVQCSLLSKYIVNSAFRHCADLACRAVVNSSVSKRQTPFPSSLQHIFIDSRDNTAAYRSRSLGIQIQQLQRWTQRQVHY